MAALDELVAQSAQQVVQQALSSDMMAWAGIDMEVGGLHGKERHAAVLVPSPRRMSYACTCADEGEERLPVARRTLGWLGLASGLRIYTPPPRSHVCNHKAERTR